MVARLLNASVSTSVSESTILGRWVYRTTLLALLLVMVGACGGDGAKRSAEQQVNDGLRSQVLASTDGGRYAVSSSNDTITVRSPESNPPVRGQLGRRREAGVIREAFVPDSQVPRTDQRVCVTMHSVVSAQNTADIADYAKDPDRVHLPGVVLRVQKSSSSNRVNAIAVHQTLKRGAVWVLSVDAVTVDVENGELSSNIRPIDLVDMRGSVGWVSAMTDEDDGSHWMKPGPWRMCVRAMGTTLSVKLWPTSEREPSWKDDDRVGKVTLPRKFVYAGRAGVYEGYLSPGRTSTFTDLSVSALY